MRTIDVEKIMRQSGLKPKETAQHLFPGNSYPELALKRVLTGKALLNSEQVLKLADFAKVPIARLYGIEWGSMKTKGDITTLSNGDFRAELDTKTWITKIYDKDSLFHDSIIHKGTITLSKYLIEINEIITKYKTTNEKNQSTAKRSGK